MLAVDEVAPIPRALDTLAVPDANELDVVDVADVRLADDVELGLSYECWKKTVHIQLLWIQCCISLSKNFLTFLNIRQGDKYTNLGMKIMLKTTQFYLWRIRLPPIHITGILGTHFS